MKTTDLGIGQLRADLAKAKATTITVGWQGASGGARHPQANATVAEVGAWQEYGTATAPARPTLQTTFEAHGDTFVAASRTALSNLVDGRAAFADLAPELGRAAVEAARKTLDDATQWAEPLSPRTVARKGHPQPLLDTGTLRAAISWAERRNGEPVRQGGEDE